MNFDLEGLRQTDAAAKVPNADHEWALAHRYYEDQALTDTLVRLRELGLGVRENLRPLQVNILRRVIHRLAVVYARPPTRWLRPISGGERLAESTPAHQAMLSVLRRAQYDLAWRLIDRSRALMRQAVLRLYPSDAKGSVVARCFPPFAVMRDPDPSCPDLMDLDRRFALKLSGTTPKEPEIWEAWQRNGKSWTAMHCNEKGEELEQHPFRATGGAVPYELLPVQIVYDDFPGGRAFLPPVESRTSWAQVLSIWLNELWNLVLNEAHTDEFVMTQNAQDVPSISGPGSRTVLPRDAQIQTLAKNPKIKESVDVVTLGVRLMNFGEDLPVSEFDEAKQIVTGAALRVQSGPLLARREAQIELVPEDERMAYRRFRAIHNLHRTNWPGAPELDPSTDIEIEIAPLDIPTDERQTIEADAKAIALGLRSEIDAIQRLHNVSRSQAIEIWQRVSRDARDYPSRSPRAQPTEPVDPTEPVSDDGRSSAQLPDSAPSALS